MKKTFESDFDLAVRRRLESADWSRSMAGRVAAAAGRRRLAAVASALVPVASAAALVLALMFGASRSDDIFWDGAASVYLGEVYSFVADAESLGGQ